jgi:4,5-DOPA dioxygenase extradiol
MGGQPFTFTTMTTLPTLFISHGAPDLPLRPSPTLDFFKELGQQLGQPDAILVVSAHWGTDKPAVGASPAPETIHDFWGFAPELYDLQYPAPGAPQLAQRASALLSQAGIEHTINVKRGLDHGAWVPLMLMYPDANIPVMQVSLQPSLDPVHHWQLGQALSDLRHANVLILASGSVTHDLRSLRGYDFESHPPEWVQQFDQWLAKAIAHQDYEALLDYRQQAPYAVENHPTDEHLLPLFVAMGAAGETAKGVQIHSSFNFGVLSMAAYAFQP